MEPGKIVWEGRSRQGKTIVIRSLQQDDAEALCRHMNALSEERTFIRFQGEQFTLEEEAAYITGQLQHMEQNQAIQLVALCEGSIIGVADVNRKDLVEQHVGVLGMSVAQPYRGEGIGALLLETVLKEAAAQLPHLRIIVLEVFSDNTLAIAMYHKFGFVAYGRLPEGVLHHQTYVDTVYMYRKIDTVHLDPCLIYWRHDSRRTNRKFRNAPEPGARAPLFDPRRVAPRTRTIGDRKQAHRSTGKAEDAPASICESECEAATR
jgi:RimJ/RimL family protein N-acetyltransferase